MTLRDYQVDIVERCAREYTLGRRSVCAVLPTGAGKTRVAVTCVERHLAREPNACVVWLAPLRELVKQARGAFGSDVHVTSFDADDESQETLFSRVIVTTVHSLAISGARPRATMLVLDEAQFFFGTPEWNTVVKSYIDADTRVLSLTATPSRPDGTPLAELADALVVGPSVRALTKLGFLVPCRVFAPENTDAIAAYRRFADGSKAAVFCANVAAARELAARFNEAGVSAASADATDRGGLDAHRDGRIKVLCNVFLLSVGYDDPSIETVILDRGCSNPSTYLQIVGRALRPVRDKSHATLIDLRGSVYQHGLPDEPRKYSLLGRAISFGPRPRREPLKACETCYVLFRPGDTACLCSPAVRPVDPSVPTPKAAAAIDRQRALANQPEHLKRAYFEKQRALADTNGWKPGAAAFRFKARYGHFPPRDWT